MDFQTLYYLQQHDQTQSTLELNVHKDMQDFYSEDYQTLQGKIKQDLNKWINMLHL